MSTSKNSTEKKNVVKSLNLSAIKKNLQNIVLTEKKTRENLYNYPDTLRTEKERNSKEGKKFRSSLRRKLEWYCTQILIMFKYDRIEEMKKLISEFNGFYKKNYRINDLTVSSVSQSAKDEKLEHLKYMFEVIKENNVPAKKEKSANVPKKEKKVKVETPVSETSETPIS